MAFQFGTTFRTNRIGQLQTTIGSTGTLKVFSGAEPANCGAADPSGLLATINLPATFMAAASGGAASMTGTWSASASATGTAACWRMYDSSSVCQLQGNTTDMTFNNTSIASGQTVSVTAFTITDGNA